MVKIPQDNLLKKIFQKFCTILLHLTQYAYYTENLLRRTSPLKKGSLTFSDTEELWTFCFVSNVHSGEDLPKIV